MGRASREAQLRAKATYRAKQKTLKDAIKDVPCMDCGGSFPPECMDFDHRNDSDKKYNLGGRVDLPIDVFLEEVAKCDIVCANCHRIRTKRRGQNVNKQYR